MQDVLTADDSRQAEHSPAFEAELERLRDAIREMQDSMTSPTSRLSVWLERRILGFRWRQARTPKEILLLALAAAAAYLVWPTLATIVTRSWVGAPVWTWIGVAALFGVFQLAAVRLEGEGARGFEDLLQLPAAIADVADLRSLVDGAQRSWRARHFAPPAALLTLGILAASAARDPDAFWGLHPGTLVLLALLVYEVAEEMIAVLLSIGIYRQEAHFDHHLSWLDPLASPPVQTTLHSWFAGTGPGTPLVVLYSVAVTVLVAPVAPDVLVVPLAGIALIGVALVIASLIALHRGVEGIVERSRDTTLAHLRRRIEVLEPGTRELTPDDAERLRALLAIYATVRDAPTGPSGTATLTHALTALAIPALAFFLAVMSEVYAERLLNQLLP